MRIGLAVYESVNNDIAFNISQIEKAMSAARGTVDLLCFGEAFLQGFDSLNWNYENDKLVAISVDSDIMRQLFRMTLRYQVDLLLGYIEACGNDIYSSCAVIEKGRLICNYRRISQGWKEYSITDQHYKEGAGPVSFLYRRQPVTIALCGDLWDFPEAFKTDGLLIWPVYVNFDLEQWAAAETEYAAQANLAARKTLMVNPISKDPMSHGGAFYFVDGTIQKKLTYGTEGILNVEI